MTSLNNPRYTYPFEILILKGTLRQLFPIVWDRKQSLRIKIMLESNKVNLPSIYTSRNLFAGSRSLARSLDTADKP